MAVAIVITINNTNNTNKTNNNTNNNNTTNNNTTSFNTTKNQEHGREEEYWQQVGGKSNEIPTRTTAAQLKYP